MGKIKFPLIGGHSPFVPDTNNKPNDEKPKDEKPEIQGSLPSFRSRYIDVDRRLRVDETQPTQTEPGE